VRHATGGADLLRTTADFVLLESQAAVFRADIAPAVRDPTPAVGKRSDAESAFKKTLGHIARQPLDDRQPRKLRFRIHERPEIALDAREQHMETESANGAVQRRRAIVVVLHR